MARTADEALRTAGALLLDALDIVTGRAEDGVVPAWCEERGWTNYLLALSDDDVSRCEAGLFEELASRAPPAPSSLVDLVTSAARAAELPPIGAPERLLSPATLRLVPARKQRQIGALLGAIAKLAAGARRLVDVGAGRGHLTRFAASAFEREAIGLELDPERVETATRLADSETRARFSVFDACAEPITLEPDDLALGLHACGEVGDRLVVEAARSGASLALVSCCFQKTHLDVREPLAPASGGLALPRHALGLANLSASAEGVERPLADTMKAREARLALRALLIERGLRVEPGEEMRGVNRRQARGGLGALAEKALAARGLPPPSRADIERHEARARIGFARARRLSLPRSLLARLVETTLVLDRAARLEQSGHAVRVGTLFPASVSPRNLAVLAARNGLLLS